MKPTYLIFLFFILCSFVLASTYYESFDIGFNRNNSNSLNDVTIVNQQVRYLSTYNFNLDNTWNFILNPPTAYFSNRKAYDNKYPTLTYAFLETSSHFTCDIVYNRIT